MDKETLRMQMLAGVITESEYAAAINQEVENTEKDSLNEHYVAGGIVGIGAINQIPSRAKTDYEDAFEHFLGQKYEIKEEMEAEEEKKYYITMKSKDGKGGGTLQNLPNHIRNTYSDALRSIEYLRNNFKKGKKYTYYVSDIDGNPVDEDGNIINESRLTEMSIDDIFKADELANKEVKEENNY